MDDRKRLFVLRHAKSSWDDPGLDDHERPLAPRGRRAAKAMAAHMRALRMTPSLVICSSARRTRQTLDDVAPGGQQLIEPELYSASATDLLQRLRGVPEATESVMVIGHNPALQILVLSLAETGDARCGNADLEAVHSKFPTGALAALSFDCRWSELAPGRAALESFVTPKQLH
jgi:phosphohistidine phosphatase